METNDLESNFATKHTKNPGNVIKKVGKLKYG